MTRFLILSATHMAALAIGFVLGIFFLPILTAPPSIDEAVLTEAAGGALFTTEFEEDLPGNDLLHWGRGTVSITETSIVHDGSLAPGPDYRVYLVPDFVDHEDGFTALRDRSLMVGEVAQFDGFILDLPEGTDLEAYTTVLVWCEAFGEFIAAARYR
jgi:hypothetical protein